MYFLQMAFSFCFLLFLQPHDSPKSESATNPRHCVGGTVLSRGTFGVVLFIAKAGGVDADDRVDRCGCARQ